MSVDHRPHAVINAAGIRAFGAPTVEDKIPGVVYLAPAAGVHVEVRGQEAGSLHVASRTTGALSSDWQGFRYKKAGVFRWTHGSNMEGDGADEWTLIRNEPGDDQVAVRIKRNLEARFAGPIYSAGVAVATASTTWAASATTTGVFNPARLGSGTPDDTTYLRGDGAWRPLSEIEGSSSGLPFIPPNDLTTPSILGRNAADTLSTAKIYGAGAVDLGNWGVAKHANNNVTAAVMLNATRTQDSGTGLGEQSIALISQSGAGLVLVANVGGMNTQWGGSQRLGVLGLSTDGGVRCSQNMKTNGQSFEPHKPSAYFGMESDGNLHWRWYQAENLGTGAYTPGGSQTMVFSSSRTDSAGETYRETAEVSLMLMQPGRSFEICASAVINAPQPVARFGPDRRMVLFNRMYWESNGGFAPMRFNAQTLSGGGAIALGNGDFAFDGADMAFMAGGVLYKLSKTAY